MIKHLYLHFPFANSNCRDCDQKKNDNKEITNWVTSMIDDILNNKKLDENLETLYIGGLDFASIDIKQQEKLFLCLKQRFFTIDEFSIESYPGSAQELKIKLWSDNNVNRVVLKTKTFDHKKLSEFGMTHDFMQTKKIIKTLKQNGINNVCLDINFGFGSEILQHDISLIKKLNPKAVYWYSHKLKGDVESIDLICQKMTSYSYHRYEIGGFAKENKYQSKHSQAYYDSKEWLALGKGGVSFVDDIYNAKKLKGRELHLHVIMMALQHITGLNLQNQKHYQAYLFYKKEINALIQNKQLVFNDEFISIAENNLVNIDRIILALL